MLICKYLPVFQRIVVSWFMESVSLDSKTSKMKAVQSLEMSETNGLMTLCHFPGDLDCSEVFNWRFHLHELLLCTDKDITPFP